MVAITMDERRSFSKVLFTILLLGGFFATETVFGTPVPDDDGTQGDENRGPSNNIKVTKDHEVLEVHEGDPITIPCNMEFPSAWNNALIWKFRNGTAAEIVLFIDESVGWLPGASIYNISKDHSLVIKKATSQIVGTYICFVIPEIFTTHDVRLKDKSDKSGSGAARNYASICLLVTIFMTLLNR